MKIVNVAERLRRGIDNGVRREHASILDPSQTSTAKPWAAWLIATACILMFIAPQVTHWSTIVDARRQWRVLSPDHVWASPTFWKLALPATLMHASVQHLLLNLWCLSVFGPVLERRLGSLSLLLAWVFMGYTAMGVELSLSGSAKVGLSEFTYMAFGFALSELRATFRAPRLRWTAVGMIAVVVWGVLEWVRLLHTDSGIGHIAHAYAIGVGLALGVLTSTLGGNRRIQ